MDAVASLKNVPTSPRKMRVVADLIRGEKVNNALNILKFESKVGAGKLEKLLLSAISNWQLKYEDQKLEEADLFIKEIRVDSGRILKRLRPAPQGRAHRIRKRSNHVTLIVGSNNTNQLIGNEVKEEGIKEVKKEAKAEVKKKVTKKKETKTIKPKASAKKNKSEKK